MIHGGIGREERRRVVEALRNDPRVLVPVANDAAGEGVNLQPAHLMVNYGLSWNPNRLEQRFGRIHQIGQTVAARLLETWVWLLDPDQPDLSKPEIEWHKARVQEQEGLAVRTARKLVADERLLVRMEPARLRMELDKGLWRDVDHVATKQLRDYLASYLYLARLRDLRVLEGAINAGLAQLVGDQFAYAERFDDVRGRYEGLRSGGGSGSIALDGLSVLVKPETARRQLKAERAHGQTSAISTGVGAKVSANGPDRAADAEERAIKRHFFGTIELDPTRMGRQFGLIAESILHHLGNGGAGGRVRVTVEIEAEQPEGFDEQVRRTVGENRATLRFKQHGFLAD